mmetsp:Transcript_90358/g.234328  ORF Transcript_90358/g.234328 Transcript_90358/m.234328 type:complete len:224 (+) Transcript_90358:1013-1684(+)
MSFKVESSSETWLGAWLSLAVKSQMSRFAIDETLLPALNPKRHLSNCSSCGSCHATPILGGIIDDSIGGKLGILVRTSTSSTSGALSSSHSTTSHGSLLMSWRPGAESRLRTVEVAPLLVLQALLLEMLGQRLLCTLRALLSRLYVLLQRLLARLPQRPVLTLLWPPRLLPPCDGKCGKWPGCSRGLDELPATPVTPNVSTSVHWSMTVCQSMAFLSLISFSY